MPLDLKQDLKLTQQLIMTPQLQQAIKILQLSRLELRELINQELKENPLLEEELDTSEENENTQQLQDLEEEPIDDEFKNESSKMEMDWESFMESYNIEPPPVWEKEAPKDLSFENIISSPQSLQDYLLWQLKMSHFSSKEEEIAEFIIGNIDDNGFLKETVENIATELAITPEKVEEVLNKIQQFEPLGVGARDIKECLLLQAKKKFPQDMIVQEIIKNNLNFLQNKNYTALSKKLKVSKETIYEAVKKILKLNPKPGASYGDFQVQNIIPDLFVFKVDNDYIIVLNDDGLPRLRISSYYRKLFKDKKGIYSEAKEFIQEKLKSATWLIKSIGQRQQTLYKVAKSIVKFQRDFFDKGINYLKPLILKDVADDIGIHESTVSRATNNKYLQCSHGIFELKFFFTHSIDSIEGKDVSSTTVKNMIREIIASEDPRKPLSDQEIVKTLKEKNISIARRTVSKYRELMNILPSNQRKKEF
ncbi:MAG: RNA polymerase factor sigma-54 [Deltaproteobacteria bacterium]|nr:RNA polymerase factor sigma-54 [Deltaproteobacteria bacterium]